MNNKLLGRSGFKGVACLVLAATLGGCATDGAGTRADADTGGPVGVWSPHSRARFVTLSRSTTYTIVREDGRDLIVVEEGIGGGPADAPDRFVWIVTIPNDAPEGAPVTIEIDDGTAWLLEYRKGLNTHAQPVWGSVTVMGRTEHTLDAMLELAAPGAPEAPGQLTTNDITLASRLALARYQTIVPGTDDDATRSGADGAVDRDPTPRSKYGAN